MRNSEEKATDIKVVMENFQDRQMPGGDEWGDINNIHVGNIHREESECKMLQRKMEKFHTKKNRRN